MVPALPARLIAEFIGTLTLIAVGVGAILSVSPATTPDGLIAVALAHGLAIAVMVTAVGHVSGGHFNPAVTFGMLLTRQIRIVDALAYVGAQLAGATAGAALIKWAYPDDLGYDKYNGGAPGLLEGVSLTQGIVLEALMTFFLVFVVFGVAVDRLGAFSAVAGLPIGLTVTAGILMGGKLTGAAMNPAREFGPALIANHWQDVAAYWVGPFIGAAIASLLYIYGIKPRMDKTS